MHDLSDRHTLGAALEREELTEEQIYFLLRFAGHLGYNAAIRRLNPDPWWVRARQWLVKFGGWEPPHLGQWDRGAPAFSRWATLPGGRRFRMKPWPVSLFNHRIVLFSWGWQFQVAGGYLVWSQHNGNGPQELYWSPNGTTWHDDARVFWPRAPQGKRVGKRATTASGASSSRRCNGPPASKSRA